MYVLEKRLHQQAVADWRRQQVLHELLTTLFNTENFEQNLLPGAMLSLGRWKQILQKVTHSSVMRLNETSMGKLFDLICMGLKLQLVLVDPDQLMDVTRNHVEELLRLTDPELATLLNHCLKRFEEETAKLSLADLCCLRQYLAALLQDYRIKSVAMLRDEVQDKTGALVVPSSGELKAYAQPPGTVRYYSQGVEISSEVLQTATAAEWLPSSQQRTTVGMNSFCRHFRRPSKAVRVALLSGRDVLCDPSEKRRVRDLREEAGQKLEVSIGKLITSSGELLSDDMTLRDANVGCGDSLTAVLA